MWGNVFLQIVAYASVLTFVSVLIAKAVKYATMPIHLRWELYPVAHETERTYGGSYFEDLDWSWRARLKGYKILFDLLKSLPKNEELEEIPYSFGNRYYGRSKISKRHIWIYFKSLFK